MSRNFRPGRSALAGVAAVALAASGLYAFAAASAQAATDPTKLRIEAVYPADGSGSAGTCQVYRVYATDELGKAPSDTGTVVVTLKEGGTDTANQDVDFCQPPAQADSGSGVRVHQAKYMNGERPSPTNPNGPRTQCYVPGESITPGQPAPNPPTPPAGAQTCTSSNPDVASDEGFSVTNPTFPGGVTNTNPASTDYVDDVDYTQTKTFIEFGVAGHLQGTATIDAFIDRNHSGTRDTGDPAEPAAPQKTVTFTSGGDPDSTAAYNAVTKVDTDGRTDFVAVKSPLTPASIDLTLTNPSDTVFGVKPSYRVQSGPNASATITPCGRSDDYGRSSCSYIGSNLGTDTLLIWVDHSGTGATNGPDSNEPTKTVTVTTYAQPAASTAARFIDLTPNTPVSTTAGESRTFTATVTDAAGVPAQGTQVTFEETGPGQIEGGNSPDGINSSKVVASAADGRALITIVTRPGESGQQTVTAKISNVDTDCGRLFNGSTGTCSDSTTNSVSAPSPQPSATPTATITPSGSPSATPSASPGCRVVTLRVNTPTINATGQASISVSGATPGSRVELQGYSQNHYGTANFDNDTTNPDRVGTTDQNGSVSFNDLRPASNTRLRARMVNCAYSASAVINVRAQETLQVTRISTRTYTFSGRSIPARPGGLIVSLYRIVGSACAAGVEPSRCPGEKFVSQARAQALGSPNEGLYQIRVAFPAKDQNVRDEFVVKTGQDAQNAPGRSNARSLLIY